MDQVVSFPEFRERSPWWGGDLQTVRNVFFPPDAPDVAGAFRDLRLVMSDGTEDALACRVDWPMEPPGSSSGLREAVVLVHGLGGSSESHYMVSSARYWLDRGHAVARINLRGAGASGESCRLSYHAGRSGDLRDALRGLAVAEPALAAPGIAIIGFSLGGNMLLKFLAEHAAEFPVRWAASVSAPIDLAAASRCFGSRRNRMYQRSIMASLRRESLRVTAQLDARERDAVGRAKTLLEFDEHFVAPRNGYSGAAEYYSRNSSREFLPGIDVPTLLVQAHNDPWIPIEAYRDYPWHQVPKLTPLLPAGGGHVGFHARGHREAWYNVCIAHFARTRRA
ncbi:MAG: alpha/beta fold hydrolase [Myxococcota bacterium]|nr:alpha/beta fold hydrolase [Myxococcota bacterium]